MVTLLTRLAHWVHFDLFGFDDRQISAGEFLTYMMNVAIFSVVLIFLVSLGAGLASALLAQALDIPLGAALAAIASLLFAMALPLLRRERRKARAMARADQ